MATDADAIGKWKLMGPERGYNSRPFWKLVRDNRGWMYGQETLMTPKKHDAKRFYIEARAVAMAAKLNEISS